LSEAAKKTSKQATESHSESQHESHSIHALQEEVNRLESQVKESKEKYLYLYADFENARKRAQTEKLQAIQYGSELLAKDLLEVIDNLERSLKHIAADAHPGLVEGLSLTLNQFKAILEKHGIKPIHAEGQKFDPHLHEAIGQVSSDEPPGTVLYEDRSGYLYQDRLLRPSRVMISGGPTQ
jgi:molecular chaperone GrpE